MFAKFVTSFCVALLVLSVPALAQKPTRTKQFDAWGTYFYPSGNGKVCFILSVPVPGKMKPDDVNHGQNFLILTQRPGQNVSYEPQIVMGYALKEESKVKVLVDTKEFNYFSDGNIAWSENAAEEPAMIEAMRAGSTMTVAAVSKRGTKTHYTYSLSGVTAALKEISKCK